MSSRQAEEPTTIEGMLKEATDLLHNPDIAKSQSSRRLALQHVRMLEVMVYGRAVTALPRLTDHPEDHWPQPQPDLPRRF